MSESPLPHLVLRGKLNRLRSRRPDDDPLILRLAEELREETAVYRAVTATRGLPLSCRVRAATAVLAADEYAGGETG